MVSRICWHCGCYSHMTQQGNVASTGTHGKLPRGNVWFAIFKCDACGYLTMGMIHYLTSNDGTMAAQAQSDFQDDDLRRIVWLPQTSVWKEYEDVPTDIAAVASEAYACSSINANRAAVLMARTALEATAKNKGVTSGSLYEKIDELAAGNIITGQLAQEAHEIRLLGNEMAHGDPSTPVSGEDVSDILGFLDTVLDYVYQQPIAIQKRKAQREKREENKK